MQQLLTVLCVSLPQMRLPSKPYSTLPIYSLGPITAAKEEAKAASGPGEPEKNPFGSGHSRHSLRRSVYKYVTVALHNTITTPGDTVHTAQHGSNKLWYNMKFAACRLYDEQAIATYDIHKSTSALKNGVMLISTSYCFSVGWLVDVGRSNSHVVSSNQAIFGCGSHL